MDEIKVQAYFTYPQRTQSTDRNTPGSFRLQLINWQTKKKFKIKKGWLINVVEHLESLMPQTSGWGADQISS